MKTDKRTVKNALKRLGYTDYKKDVEAYEQSRYAFKFCTYKSTIYIHARKLDFCLEYAPCSFRYSAICSGGNELGMSLDSCIAYLFKYLNCELSENELIEYISKID